MTDQRRHKHESDQRPLQECIFGLEEAKERGELLAKERKRLEDHEKLLLAILDGSMNGITLSIDDQFVWVNQGFTDILGWSFNEIRGKKTSFIFRDENEFGVVNRKLIQDLKNQKRFSYESYFLHKNGSSVACLLTGRLVDTEDWSKGVVFSLTDIGQRIQSEKALSESEQRYRALIDHSPSGTCLCQDKKIVFLNKRFADILGYSQDELLNAPFPKILSSESLSDFEKFAASTEEGVEFKVHAEFLAVSSSRESLTLEVWINQIEHNGRPAMLMNFFDITSRRQTEEKIQLSEEKLRWELTLNKALTELYVSVLSSGSTMADISRGLLEKALALTNSEEGFVSEIDKKSQRITFYAYTGFFDRLARMKTKQLASIIQETRENVISQLFSTSKPVIKSAALMFSDHNPELFDKTFFEKYMLAPVLAGDETIGHVFLLKSNSGFSSRDFQALKRLATFYAVGLRRRKDEQALQASEQRLELALIGANLGTWDLNLITGEVIINSRLAAMLGYDLDEIGPSVFRLLELIHPDDVQQTRELFELHLSGQTPFFEAEYRMFSKTGDYLWILSRGQIVEVNKDGKPIRAAGTYLDVTERKAIAQQLSNRDRLLECAAEISRDLLTYQEFDLAIGTVLSRLGETTRVDRVAIFENHEAQDQDEFFMSLRHEWVRDNISAQIDNPDLQNVSYGASLPRWFETLSDGKSLDGLIRDFPLTEREILEPQEIISMLMVPIIIQGRFWGLIAFEDCTSERTWVESEVSILQATAGNIGDAIERERTQQRLNNSHQQFLAVMDGLDAFVYVADMSTYEILFVSRQLENIYGRDVIGKTCWQELHPDQKGPCPFCTNDKLIDQHGKPTGVYVWERQNPKTGQWLGIRNRAIAWPDGRIVRLEVAQDISEIKEAENRLRKANEFQKLLLATAATAIFTVDASRIVTSVNDEFEIITGYTSEEVIGKPCLSFGEEPCINKCGLTEMSLGENISRSECTIRAKNGQLLTVLKNAVSLNNEAGEFTGAIESFVDVTELIEAKKAAEQASRSKSEFLAKMSHEIRTPMNGVLGMTELALNTALTEEQREYLETSHASAEALLAIINDILDFSKIEAGKLDLNPEPFNFRDRIDSIVSGLAIQAHQKGLELLSKIDPSIPEVVIGDSTRIGQILINLVGNAIKFTEKGEVMVQVDSKAKTNDDLILEFVVRDTGIGIPTPFQDKVFGAFEQGEIFRTRKYGGTGLGLTISAQLVELMGGKIWFRSEQGRGSEFCFTVPLTVGSSPAVADGVKKFDIYKGLNALIVDDNATNRRILETALSTWGFNVSSHDSGQDALNWLDESARACLPISVILVDCCMPEMDGFELTHKIRSLPVYSNVPVIMLTSAGWQEEFPNVSADAISSYLTKPVKMTSLMSHLSSMIEKNNKPTTSPAENAKKKKKQTPGRSLRILLAEDNVVNQKLAKRMLEKMGHDVMIVSNGKEAVEALDKDKFDVFLTDIQMPEMDGYEATRIIRQAESEGLRTRIPIIAMTAYAMESDREMCFEAGMDGYVSKPVRSKELTEALDAI